MPAAPHEELLVLEDQWDSPGDQIDGTLECLVVVTTHLDCGDLCRCIMHDLDSLDTHGKKGMLGLVDGQLCEKYWLTGLLALSLMIGTDLKIESALLTWDIR